MTRGRVLLACCLLAGAAAAQDTAPAGWLTPAAGPTTPVAPGNLTSSVAERDGRIFFFPLFRVARFANTQCTATNNLNGTCFTRSECSGYGGTASGTCASGLGVCCVILKECGTTSRINCTYFSSPSYPTAYTDSGRCTIGIYKCNTNVCQLRIDFIDFTIAQPNSDGVCVTDFMVVTGSTSTVPVICGDNTGEHIYVNFPTGSTPIEITISTSSTSTVARRWLLKVTQIECTDPWRAPVGCLMYFKDISGTVKSFNYNTLAPTTTPFGTRQLANTNYGVCVRMADGYCSIQWSQNTGDAYSFTVTGDTSGLDTTVLGTVTAQLTGSNCTTDFIVIPNPFQGGLAVDSDRFCGNGLADTITFSKPFVLTVVTNADETTGTVPDNDNRGFCLTFTQLPCMA
ncbi:uncharacterized protein LOC134540601 isoform X2 [Bacillus rossius redtenbacheri]